MDVGAPIDSVTIRHARKGRPAIRLKPNIVRFDITKDGDVIMYAGQKPREHGRAHKQQDEKCGIRGAYGAK